MCYRMVVSLTGSGREMSFGGRPRCRGAVGGRGVPLRQQAPAPWALARLLPRLTASLEV